MGAERRMEHRRGDRYEHGHCCEISRRLGAIDFALVETALYLDAHPDHCEALAYYHKLLAERESLAHDYAQTCGPLTHRDGSSDDFWLWVKTPWPWEHEAN
ncbi:MAG: spore coat protein CotJB [Clostridia bacterium]|nr:spore coat protein CotJB [Clostridia bacterium]